MSALGMVDIVSTASVLEAADRLESLLREKGLKIFARIDQAAEAQAAGLSLRPMVLLIFGDPKTGTPLMERYPTLAIDLPLKALVWEAAEGEVRLSYNSPEYLQQRHGMETLAFAGLVPILERAARG